MAANALFRLAELTGEVRWHDHSRPVLEAMATANHPAASSNSLCALDFLLAPPMEIAVVGEPSSAQARKLLQNIQSRYLPNKVVACGANASVDLLKNRPQINGATTVYICRNQA